MRQTTIPCRLLADGQRQGKTEGTAHRYSASLISSCGKRRSVAVKDGSRKQIGVSISISLYLSSALRPGQPSADPLISIGGCISPSPRTVPPPLIDAARPLIQTLKGMTDDSNASELNWGGNGPRIDRWRRDPPR